MGEVFAGRYELLDLIGQGGMGSVWRVHDRREDRVVAAKVLRQSDAASLLRFVRETAFRVQHPHVVTPLGWAGEDDRVLFTMPIVDGGSVATLVGDHGPLPATFVAEVLRQLLDGLSAVHASRIVHRDVKPANVLLAATGAARPHVYLTDFGIAVELDGPRLTETNVAIGTPGYMAPEQRRGELTTASDLYAVGALAVHMLTAVPPEPSETPERPADVPDSLWDLAADLLAPDPAERPGAPTAIERLGGPALAWTACAAGDVEVLRQIEGEDDHPVDDPTVVATALDPDVGGGPAPADTSPRVVGPVVDEGVADDQPSGSRPRRVALAAVLALVLVGVAALAIAWSSGWGSDPGGGDGTTEPGASSSPASSTSSSSSAPSPTSSSGSVSVGTVVSEVGQPCEFSDVGLREETTDGVAVVCRLGDDGGYTWESADS